MKKAGSFQLLGWAARRPVLGAVLFNVLFGLAYLPLKLAGEQMQGNTAHLLAFRFGLATLVLLALRGAGVLTFRSARRLLPILVPVCLIQLASGFAETSGLSCYPTGKASVIMALGPLVAMVLAIFLLREYPRPAQWLGLGVSVAGVVLVNAGGADTEATLKGFLLMLAAMTFSALMGLCLRKSAGQATPMEVTYITSLVSALCYGTVSFTDCLRQGDALSFFAPLTNPVVLLCLLYLGCVSSLYASSLRNLVFTVMPVTQAVSFNGVSTITAVLVGVLARSEAFGTRQVVGIALVLLGVWRVNRQPPTPSPLHKHKMEKSL